MQSRRSPLCLALLALCYTLSSNTCPVEAGRVRGYRTQPTRSLKQNKNGGGNSNGASLRPLDGKPIYDDERLATLRGSADVSSISTSDEDRTQVIPVGPSSATVSLVDTTTMGTTYGNPQTYAYSGESNGGLVTHIIINGQTVFDETPNRVDEPNGVTHFVVTVQDNKRNKKKGGKNKGGVSNNNGNQGAAGRPQNGNGQAINLVGGQPSNEKGGSGDAVAITIIGSNDPAAPPPQAQGGGDSMTVINTGPTLGGTEASSGVSMTIVTSNNNNEAAGSTENVNTYGIDNSDGAVTRIIVNGQTVYDEPAATDRVDEPINQYIMYVDTKTKKKKGGKTATTFTISEQRFISEPVTTVTKKKGMSGSNTQFASSPQYIASVVNTNRKGMMQRGLRGVPVPILLFA